MKRVLSVIFLLALSGCDETAATGDELSSDMAVAADSGRQIAGDAAIPPCVPTEERCDGEDNNCDGVVDDGFEGLGTPCTDGEGPCAGRGQRACAADGNAVICDAVARLPEDEICDGIDNDCDGTVDEGFDFAVDPRHCGGCDRPCTYANAQAGCFEGTCDLTSCDPGFGDPNGVAFDGCECETTGEERCDGTDNDCDGQVDEGFELGTPCAAGVGACSREGTLICGVDGAVCDAVEGAPVDEICNGIDDNCDGRVDETFDGDGDGAPWCEAIDCAAACPEGFDCERYCAIADCADEDPTISPLARDICEDGVDQNCDGLDASCRPATGRMTALAVAVANDPNCRDVDGDGTVDNAFGGIGALLNGQLADNIAADALILFIATFGLEPPGAAGLFDLAVLAGARDDQGNYVVMPDSLDAEGRPIIVIPNARADAGLFNAGPGLVVLDFPFNGLNLVVRVSDAVISGQIGVDAAGLTITEGYLSGVVTQADLEAAAALLPPQIGDLLPVLLAPDIDLDGDGTPDAVSACMSFTTAPQALETDIVAP